MIGSTFVIDEAATESRTAIFSSLKQRVDICKSCMGRMIADWTDKRSRLPQTDSSRKPTNSSLSRF